MRFLSKKTCEKLYKLGCRSTATFGYDRNGSIRLLFHDLVPAEDYTREALGPYYVAFSLEDFVGTHEQAKQNCRILWGLKSELDGMYIWKHACYAKRHEIVDSDDWVKFIEDEIEK